MLPANAPAGHVACRTGVARAHDVVLRVDQDNRLGMTVAEHCKQLRIICTVHLFVCRCASCATTPPCPSACTM